MKREVLECDKCDQEIVGYCEDAIVVPYRIGAQDMIVVIKPVLAFRDSLDPQDAVRIPDFCRTCLIELIADHLKGNTHK